MRKTFAGPYYVFDPKLDIADRPRIWLGQAEWEGPIVEWPPKGTKSLFFAGDERDDDSYLREIFARFLPLAYRRAVTPAELDRIVNWTLKAKADRGLSFTQAVREGVKNVLCSPKFLYLGSEAMPSPVMSAEQGARAERSRGTRAERGRCASFSKAAVGSATGGWMAIGQPAFVSVVEQHAG